MKFSYNWMRELVPGLDTEPKALMRLITMKTAECEGVEEVAPLLAKASRARVLSVEEIPGSHNRKAEVDVDGFGHKTVVCGAPNCRAGLETTYVAIGVKTIDGVKSDGMLASMAELGINDEHAGIVEGWVGALEPDAVIEVDNKSLTHRPDLWGHLGMAREVAAITHKPLRDPANVGLIPDDPAAIGVEIADLTLCPRYSALVFDNVKVQPSPPWLQYRLTAIGLNPINNIVDVTNYVMAELPQPMHAFDADRLHGTTIFIRPARAGERLLALNDESYDLTPANLVIADAEGPVALAGVIGGLDSAIDDKTTRIVLESANFQAAGVRKTSSALKIRTDASMRFEKAQDPVNTVRGLARAIELLREVSPGIRLVGGLADAKAPLRVPPTIELRIDWLTRKLGRTVTEAEVRGILEALDFGVAEAAPGVLLVSVPSWRATKDIAVKDDVLEEVGRIVGYDSITPTPPLVAATVPPASPERLFHRHVRSVVADQGFTEVSNYSFVNEELALRFGLNLGDHVRVLNPIVAGQDLMRTSLLPGVWRSVLENTRNFPNFRFFEIGREIHKRPLGLPHEVPHVAAVVYAREGDGASGLFELTRLADCLMPGCEIEPSLPRPYEHPERAANLVWQGEVAGRLLEFHPSLGIEGRTAVLDLDLAVVRRLTPEVVKYQPVRRFPTSAFDLSVVVPLKEPVGFVRKRLEASAGADLVRIEFVRQYTGAPLPPDRKSVSFRLTIGAADRTLGPEEVTSIRTRIIEAMQALGFELRI